MINTVEVLIHAEQLMQERYSEPIRSRQINVLAEAIICKVNEEFARRFNFVAGNSSPNRPSTPVTAETPTVVDGLDG